MPNQPLRIPFPEAGIMRLAEYASQEPQSCYDAINVRPFDPSERRMRGGSRPAIIRCADVGTASPARFLATVRGASGAETLVTATTTDVYYSTNGTSWSKATTGTNGGLTNATGRLQATDRLQKLYIADPASSYPIKELSSTTVSALVGETEPGLSACSLPTKCPLICTYRDRIVVAGGADSPNNWFMSRQGEPEDWYYGADLDDEGRAVSGTLSTAGQTGPPIVAMMPIGDEQLIFGCTNELWRLTGDPCSGGRIENISRTIGVVGMNAWCHGPEKDIYLLSANGVWKVTPYEPPIPISIDRAYNDFLNWSDSESTPITMAYSPQEWGIYVWQGGSSPLGWFYHILTKSWWRDSYTNTDFYPKAAANYGGATPTAYLASPTAIIRKVTFSGSYDDPGGGSASDNPINSSILLGPFAVGDEYADGLFNELIGILDDDLAGQTVTWGVYSGYNAEEAVDNASGSALATGTFGLGRSIVNYPMVRGQAIVIKLSASYPWAMDCLMGTVRKLGKQRLIG